MNSIYEHMSSPVLFIGSELKAKDGIAKMIKNNISSLLVKKNGKYVGILTKTDWVDMVIKEVCDPNTVKVSETMVNPIIKIDMNETMAKASSLFEERYIRHLAVTRNDEIVGILSVKDLEKYYCQLHDKVGIAHY
ncbi:MAG: CBS domain-containing protein [Nitrospinae bacterium]|nr:CBS domain-containing protein [Nitrospinota bacterium]